MISRLKIGSVVEAKVVKITNFGAFVRFGKNHLGLIHISQVARDYVEDLNEHLKIGQEVKATIIKLNGSKIDLSLKQETAALRSYPKGKNSLPSPLEEKLDKFLKTSKSAK